jgi:hypothetical protein
LASLTFSQPRSVDVSTVIEFAPKVGSLVRYKAARTGDTVRKSDIGMTRIV